MQGLHAGSGKAITYTWRDGKGINTAIKDIELCLRVVGIKSRKPVTHSANQSRPYTVGCAFKVELKCQILQIGWCAVFTWSFDSYTYLRNRVPVGIANQTIDVHKGQQPGIQF